MLTCVSIIDHHAELFIQNRNKAVGTHMAVFGDINDILVEHLMELLRIVAHLNEAAARKIHSRVFSPHRFILASGGILLYKRILNFQRIHKFFGLGFAVHVIAVDHIRLCGICDDAIGINNIDFFDVVFLSKTGQGNRRVIFVFLFDLLCDFKKLTVGFLSYRRLNIVDRNRKHFLRFNLRHSVLEDEGKGAGDQIGNDNTAEKSSLERMGDALRSFLFEKALMAEKRNHDDRQADSHGIAQHHGRCGTFDKFKGIGGVIHIGQEYQDHMDDFAHHGNTDAVTPCGLFVVEHQLPQTRGHKARENGRHGASQSGICACAPVHGEPAVKAADQTGDDACRRTENQTCG